MQCRFGEGKRIILQAMEWHVQRSCISVLGLLLQISTNSVIQNHKNFFSHSSGGQKPIIKASVGLVVSGALRKNLFFVSFLASGGAKQALGHSLAYRCIIPGSTTALCLHMPSLCISDANLLFLSLLRAPVIVL